MQKAYGNQLTLAHLMASLDETQAAAKSAQLQLQVAQVRAAAEPEPAFAQLVRAGTQALLCTPSTMFNANRKEICGLAVRHRLPSMFYGSEYVETGGLISYGTDIPAACRRAAAYVDKIIKGGKASDLPIEQPTKMELLVNMKTVRALDIKIPPAILMRIDRAIE